MSLDRDMTLEEFVKELLEYDIRQLTKQTLEAQLGGADYDDLDEDDRDRVLDDVIESVGRRIDVTWIRDKVEDSLKEWDTVKRLSSLVNKRDLTDMAEGEFHDLTKMTWGGR